MEESNSKNDKIGFGISKMHQTIKGNLFRISVFWD